MSFGISVGDFIAVGQLAWQVYRSCKEAPASFGAISAEVLSLHAVLKEVEETLRLSTGDLPPARLSGLVTIEAGCRGVLTDLQALVEKYQKLGSKTQRTWDRMKWHSEDLAELRARLTTNTSMIAAYMSTSQIVVEQKLKIFLREFRDGQLEGSVITTSTVQTLSQDDVETWRTIRKELEDIGVSVAAFDANKEFIMGWFQTAFQSALLEDSNVSRRSSSSEPHLTPVNRNLSGQDQAQTPPITKKIHRKSTRATFFKRVARIMGNEEKLLAACNELDLETIQSCLRKGIDTEVVERTSGKTPLMLVIWKQHATSTPWGPIGAIDPLLSFRCVEALLREGANVDAMSRHGESPLGLAILRMDIRVVEELLKNGADPNIMDYRGNKFVTPLEGAVCSKLSWDIKKQAMDILLKYGASIDGVPPYSCPLFAAYKQDYSDAVRELLSRGADTKALQPLSKTHPVDWGSIRYRAFASASKYDVWANWTPLGHAMHCLDPEKIRLLIQYGEDVNKPFDDCYSLIADVFCESLDDDHDAKKAEEIWYLLQRARAKTKLSLGKRRSLGEGVRNSKMNKLRDEAMALPLNYV